MSQKLVIFIHEKIDCSTYTTLSNFLEERAASIFRIKGGDSSFLQNIGTCLWNFTTSYPGMLPP